MTPEQAAGLKTELDHARKRAAILVDGMDPVAMTRRPANGGRSVAENLQHLIQTAEAMLPLLDREVSGLAERGEKARGVFRRVRHDAHPVVAGFIERPAHRADAAVHHVGRRDDVAAGLGLDDRLLL